MDSPKKEILTTPEELTPRGKRRINLETKVSLEFERFSGFVTEYSDNLSEGGMFIRTDKPQPVGSVFSFEFRLKNDIKLIQGWGEVVWIREAGGDGRPAGMGIKFIDLDSESLNLIKRIVNTENKVANQNQGGGFNPFEGLVEEEGQDVADSSSADLGEIGLGEEAPGEDGIPTLDLGDGVEEVSEIGGAAKSRMPMILGAMVVVLALLGGGAYLFRQPLQSSLNTLLFTFGLMKPNPVAKVATKVSEPANGQPAPGTPERPSPTAAAPSAPIAEASPTSVAPTAVATPAVVAAAAPMAKPATQLLSAKITKSDTQSTVVKFVFDGAVRAEAIQITKADSPPPRLVLISSGLAKHLTAPKVVLKDSRVKQLRLGLHKNPDSVHVVFDLAGNFQGTTQISEDQTSVEVEVK